jgi:uncharacterized protein YqgV (UPF0045/DUF77 family)
MQIHSWINSFHKPFVTGVALLVSFVLVPTLVAAVTSYTVNENLGSCPFVLSDYDAVIEFGGENLVANGTRDEAMSDTYATYVEPGSYEVYLASYDAFSGRENIVELQEQWKAIFLDEDGIAIATSISTQDLPDNVDEVQTVTLTDLSLNIPSEVVAARTLHAAYPTSDSQDVVPLCVGLKSVGSESNVVIEEEPDTEVTIVGENQSNTTDITNSESILIIGGDAEEDTPSGGATAGDPVPAVMENTATSEQVVAEVQPSDSAPALGDPVVHTTAGVADTVTKQGVTATPVVSGMSGVIVIRDMVVTSGSDSTVYVSLGTSEPARVRVAYSEDPIDPNLFMTQTGSVRYTYPQDAFETVHSIALGDLSLGERYYVVAEATTESGIRVTSHQYEIDVEPVTIGRCSYISDYVGPGRENDPYEVRKLQAYLTVYEGAALDINGSYDADTEAAVRNFQTRYAALILEPWGITRPTGHAYITTKRAINEIYCGSPVPLTTGELAILDQSLRLATVDDDVDIADVVFPELPPEDGGISTGGDESLSEVIVAIDEVVDEDPIEATTSASTTIAEATDELAEILKDIFIGSSDEATTTVPSDMSTASSSQVEEEPQVIVVTDIEIRDDGASLLSSDAGVQTVGISSGELTGRSALDLMKQMSAAGFAFVNQHALPILIVLVILLVVQLFVLWRMPTGAPKLRDEV